MDNLTISKVNQLAVGGFLFSAVVHALAAPSQLLPQSPSPRALRSSGFLTTSVNPGAHSPESPECDLRGPFPPCFYKPTITQHVNPLASQGRWGPRRAQKGAHWAPLPTGSYSVPVQLFTSPFLCPPPPSRCAPAPTAPAAATPAPTWQGLSRQRPLSGTGCSFCGRYFVMASISSCHTALGAFPCFPIYS